MTTARKELLQLLPETSEQQEWMLAPAVLQVAFTYCAEVLAPASLTTLTRADVLAMLVKLVAALRHGEHVLAANTRTALEHAVPGMRLQEALRIGETQLARRAKEMEEVRAALLPLEQQEEALHLQEKEYELLTTRLTELRRLERLARHLDALPRQVEELTQRLTQYGPGVTTWERQMQEKAEALIVLSTGALTQLEPRVHQALIEAQRLENACAAAAAQLQEAQTRAQQATTDLQTLHNELRPHLAANRLVADAVPQDQAPHSLLEQAERLLQQAETALQTALKAQAETQQLPRLPLMEGRHAPAAV